MTRGHLDRLGARLLVAALANAMTWVAIHSWNGMVEEPLRFTGPALTAALLITVTGAVLRGFRLVAPLVLLVQLLVVLVWLVHHQQVGGGYGGWLPTWDGLRALTDQFRSGASAINTYAAPVRAARVTAPTYLLGLALLLLLGVDLIAAGLRRPTWAGLPILVALTVPISVLAAPLAVPVFVGTAVLFVMLLATVENERTLAWGTAVTGRRQRGDGSEEILDRAAAQVPALKIGLVAATGALILPVLVPIGHGLIDTGSDGRNEGNGAGQPVRLRNPMADLRRDLVRNDHLPLLDVVTDSADPTYLRTTVLDTFTGSAWVPGRRDLPESNSVDGRLPDPPGLVPPLRGTPSRWQLQTTRNFVTTWLPHPYLTREISVQQGEWRYDLSTLDLVNVQSSPPVPVRYSLNGFQQEFDPATLAAAAPAPPVVATPMTQVPKLTDEVRRIAARVTAGGRTDYAKVVLLQDWFRSDGGFRYSLEPAAGDGMAQLERFITTDRVGYCEQFAAAMAVMTRSLGIPARVVVGFLAPEQVGEDRYRYTSDDLHAWPEVYFRGSGWVRFEPTPATRTGDAPTWTQAGAPAPTPTAPTPSASSATPDVGPAKGPTDTGAVTGSASSSADDLVRLLAVLLAGIALAVPALVRRGQRRRRLAVRSDPRLEIENFWRELRATAADLQIAWPDGRSPRAAARLICMRVDATADQAADLGLLVDALEQVRYREYLELDEDARQRCRAAATSWVGVLTEATRSRRARVAAVLPRSLFQRRRGRDEVDQDRTAASATDYAEIG